jgi:hypothetical protein
MADVGCNDCTKKRNAKLRGNVISRFAALLVGRNRFGMNASVGRFLMVAALVDKTPIAYFLDQLRLDIDVSKLPSAARDVAIVRVRALEAPSSLGGRDQSGAPPTDLRRDKLFIRIRVLEVRSGSAAAGEEYDIYFGERGRDLLYPITPDQLARDYMVAMYFDPLDAKHRLIGFPVSSKQYLDWMVQVSDYQRSKYKK